MSTTYMSQLKPVTAELEVLIQAAHMGKRSPQESKTKTVDGVEEEYFVGESVAFARCGRYTIQARRIVDRKGDISGSMVTVTDDVPTYDRPAEGNQFGARHDSFVGFASFPGDYDGHQAKQYAEDLSDEIDAFEIRSLMGTGRPEVEKKSDAEAELTETLWDELMSATE